MALRFLQIFVPDEAGSRLQELLDGLDVLGTWRDDAADDRIVVHLLMPAEDTEPIMDRFEAEFGNREGFHVVMFPVEAVLPRPQPENEEVDRAAAEPELKEAEEAGRISREELYNDVSESVQLNRVFLAMTALSAVVAAVGLLRDDVAVVIGAMVIAPLLGPNVALAFAVTLGDTTVVRQAMLANLAGIATAFVPAVLIGLAFGVDAGIPAIANRTHVNVADIVLALAAGSAGTFAFTRGISGAVIGVMVAVALVPPLVAFGMLLGSGHLGAAFGALLLTATNVICINLAGVGTFLVQGVRPRTWWEEKRAKRATTIAVTTWIVLLAILAAILYFATPGV